MRYISIWDKKNVSKDEDSKPVDWVTWERINVLSWRFLKSSIKNGITSIHVISCLFQSKGPPQQKFLQHRERRVEVHLQRSVLASPFLGLASFPWWIHKGCVQCLWKLSHKVSRKWRTMSLKIQVFTRIVTLPQETWDTSLALFSPEWLFSDPGWC